MDPELERLLHRMTTTRAAAWQQLRAGVELAPAVGVRRGDPFRVGARVFDTVTGEEGEVVGRTTENVVVSAPEKRVG